MQIFKVIGNVTLSRCHPAFAGGRLLATEAVGSSCLGGPPPTDPDLTIVWDDLGAGLDSLIAVSDGAEAAQPFRPALKPVDAFNSAILDEIHFDSKTTQSLKL
ncbi:MAG: EutN/CcmL family microcompartment protein [Aureliella sp.]|jgi:microcompartment protein CcmK/EutM